MAAAGRKNPSPAARRTIIVQVTAMFLVAACDPFVARVKGGNKGSPDWEIGVKF